MAKLEQAMRPSAAELLENCRSDGGSDCVPDRFLQKAAAECIARHAGLEPGIRPWEIYLVYNYGFHTVIWVVSNTLSESRSEAGGKSVSVQATSGEVLERNGWASNTDYVN